MTDRYFLAFAGTQTRILHAPDANAARQRIIDEYLAERAIRLEPYEVRVRELREADKEWLSDQLPEGATKQAILASV